MINSIKKYVVSKRFLYALCFIMLFVIDWTRGSQIGVVWAWTVNMTGVVMAFILFSAYPLKEFLKPIYIIYSVISIIALAGTYYWWNLNQAVIFRDQLLTAVLNVWLLGVICIKMFMDVAVYKTKKLRFYKTEIVAAAMLLWMLFSVNEDIWPGWYLVMFGLFYHTEYKRTDMNALKDGMLDGIIVSFFLLQGAAFVFRPYDVVRYVGIYNNCNMNALFYGIVWIAFLIRLYDIRKNNDKKWKEILCFLFVGVVTAFAFMTGCRTAWLAMLVSGFFFAICADFYGLKYKAGHFLKNLILYAAVVCISIPITFAAARYIPPVFHHPVWYDGEYNINKVHSFDPWDSEKYISWEEFSSGTFGRLRPLFKVFLGKEQAGIATVRAYSITVGDKTYEPGSEGYNNYASILARITFWNYYLSNGNFKGHLNTEGHQIPNYISPYVWHTQNTFVQFWYYYGIPSAILFLVTLIGIVLICLKKIFAGKTDVLVCLLYLVFWGIYGLTEAVWYPGQMILFLAFFTPKFLRQDEVIISIQNYE